MAESDYKQFCPIAMAADILCTRWTILLLRELLSGSTRFNDLKRGLPRMSTALLSLRLKELEQAGILQRRPVPGETGIAEYQLTRAGKELEPLVMAFGVWGQRWVDKQLSLERLDVGLLMWDMRRNINPEPMPDRRCTIEFIYPGAPPDQRAWWLVIAPGKGVDLCHVDPGYDVDLYISADVKTMTAIWLGHNTVRKAVQDGQVKLTGDKDLARDMQKWLGLSPFAKEKSQTR